MRLQKTLVPLLTAVLTACGGGSDDGDSDTTPPKDRRRQVAIPVIIPRSVDKIREIEASLKPLQTLSSPPAFRSF